MVVWPARIVGGAIARAQLAYLQPSVPDTLILNEVTAMTRSVDYLYDLLPAVHRMRDEGRAGRCATSCE